MRRRRPYTERDVLTTSAARASVCATSPHGGDGHGETRRQGRADQWRRPWAGRGGGAAVRPGGRGGRGRRRAGRRGQEGRSGDSRLGGPGGGRPSERHRAGGLAGGGGGGR